MTYLISQKKYKNKKVFWMTALLFLFGLLGAAFWFVMGNSNENLSEENKGVLETTTPVKTQSKAKPYLTITPKMVRQGDPALITAEGATTTRDVKSFTFDDRPLFIFLHEGQVSALLGVELRAVPDTYPIILTFNDGRQIKENLVIVERQIVRKPFDIPDKLGGNTNESEKELVSTLALEGKIINALPVVWKKLWTEKFGSPLKGPLVVTDDYGYTRLIGKSTTMPHKGTDLKADMGTPVYAMNRGVVKFASSLRNYGSTVIIDHGAGLQTVYMHLSKINVTLEQKVEKGDIIALSGDSGYTLNPHLHLTVRIWDISIDAMKFLEILGEN